MLSTQNLRGCSHDTRYQNEFHSEVSFQNEVRTSFTISAILKMTVLSAILKTMRMCHSPQTTWFAFSPQNRVCFQFT